MEAKEGTRSERAGNTTEESEGEFWHLAGMMEIEVFCCLVKSIRRLLCHVDPQSILERPGASGAMKSH